MHELTASRVTHPTSSTHDREGFTSFAHYSKRARHEPPMNPRSRTHYPPRSPTRNPPRPSPHTLYPTRPKALVCSRLEKRVDGAAVAACIAPLHLAQHLWSSRGARSGGLAFDMHASASTAPAITCRTGQAWPPSPPSHPTSFPARPLPHARTARLRQLARCAAAGRRRERAVGAGGE